MSFRVRTKRREQAERVMCSYDTNEQDRTTLQNALRFEKWGSWAVRFSVLPGVFLLYKLKAFRLNSRSLIRDFGVVAGCLLYMEGAEYFLGEAMWKTASPLVREYGIRKQAEMANKYKGLTQTSRSEMPIADDWLESN